MDKTIVPPKEGRAFHVATGKRIKITTPKGHQAADFFAYNAQSIAEWLSPPHTWIANYSVTPRPGDVFLSRFRRPMLKLLGDGAEGIHDMLLPACDQFRYEFFGYEGPHPSCSENLMVAMRRLGHEVIVVPSRSTSSPTRTWRPTAAWSRPKTSSSPAAGSSSKR